MKKALLKIIVLSLAVVLVLNMALLALGKISGLFFWTAIIIAAVFAYFILPKISHDG